MDRIDLQGAHPPDRFQHVLFPGRAFGRMEQSLRGEHERPRCVE